MSQFCSKCGTKNIDEAVFCKNCGFNMHEAAAQIIKDKEKAPTRKTDSNKDNNLHTSSSQSEMDRFFNEPKKESDLDKPTFMRENSNADDSDRVKEIQRELNDYKKRTAGDIHTTKKSEANENSSSVFNLLIGLVGIFILITIMSISEKNEPETGKQSLEEKNTNIEQVNTEFTLDNLGSAKENQNEESLDVEYFNKSQSLWDDKNSEYKNPKKAIDYLSKAIEINPNNATYYNNRSIIYHQLKEYIKAKKDNDKSIQLDPKDGRVYMNRGYNYWWMDDLPKAKADAKKACSLGECQLQKDLAEWEKNNQTNEQKQAQTLEEKYGEILLSVHDEWTCKNEYSGKWIWHSDRNEWACHNLESR